MASQEPKTTATSASGVTTEPQQAGPGSNPGGLSPDVLEHLRKLREGEIALPVVLVECCICDATINVTESNRAHPVVPGGLCCATCNVSVVLPARRFVQELADLN